MNIKKILPALLLALITTLTPSTLYAAEKDQGKDQATANIPDKPIRAIGAVIIDASDHSKVIILTKVQDKDNPNGRMVGIPLMLDGVGKKIVEEFGIMGVSPDEPNGMERIQKETETRVIYVNGVLRFKDGAGKLVASEYLSAIEYMNQVDAINKAATK